MTAAMRMMEENLKLVDGVLMILDARVPHASENKKLAHLFENKKVLYVLNKSDLADEIEVKKTYWSKACAIQERLIRDVIWELSGV